MSQEERKTYPLLQLQLGVFYDCLKFPQVMQYNIPCITELSSDINLDRVEQAIQTIFAHRPELSMRFLIDANGKPRQYVDETKQLTIVRREMTEDDFRQYAYHGFCRPFDIMGEEKVANTTIYHGRRDPRVKQAYGMFVRTIPFMMEIKQEQTVREYIASVHQEMKETLRQLASHCCRLRAPLR